MRIGVDGRALRATDERRGVAVYLEQMLRELARLHPADEYRVLVPGSPRQGALPDSANVELVSPSGPGKALHAGAALLRRPRLDRLLGRPDVLWLPAPAPVAVSDGFPYVLTLHDLSFVHRPRDYSAYARLWHRLARPRSLAARARRVVADSETVRRELIGEWRLAPEQVTTVPPGPGRTAGSGADPPLEPGYVLAVGALEPRKLPGVLVEAHRRARERGLRGGLAFAGEGPLRAELEGAGATVLGRLGDAELDSAYRGALCLACVSREEGFGFTPLEALAAGVPPVVSELPVFRETLGEAAIRVPAGDPDALAGELLRLEREPELRERIVTAGRERLKLFSWERAAHATRAVLEKAAA